VLLSGMVHQQVEVAEIVDTTAKPLSTCISASGSMSNPPVRQSAGREGRGRLLLRPLVIS
jgi:hypothetical protein